MSHCKDCNNSQLRPIECCRICPHYEERIIQEYGAKLEEQSADVRAEAIDECIKTVQSYFIKLIEDNPHWELNSVDDYALIPNKLICEALEQLKEQHGV